MDFFGDAANYAVSLFVLSMGLAARARTALLKGLFMGGYGVYVLGHASWNALHGVVPEPLTMGLVGGLALVANLSVAWLLYAYREGDANMRSVWLCSRNDAIGNVAVMMAAVVIAMAVMLPAAFFAGMTLPLFTLALLRDGAEGLEVFMVVRHHEIDFAAGALVFPGGKLAPGDEDPRVQPRCTGIAGLAPEQITLRVAAIREAFEECGILLARARGEQRLLGPTRLAELGPRYRKALDKGDLGIADMLVKQSDRRRLFCGRLPAPLDLAVGGHGAVGAEDPELVDLSRSDPGQEDLPHAGGAQRAHGVLVGVPPAEVADDGHTLRVGRPHGKRGAADLAQRGLVGAHVRAEHFPQPFVAALANQVQVEGAQGGQEVVRVGDDTGLGAGVGHAEAVVGRVLVVKRNCPDVVADGLHGAGAVVDEQLHALGAEEAGAHHGADAGACQP